MSAVTASRRGRGQLTWPIVDRYRGGTRAALRIDDLRTARRVATALSNAAADAVVARSVDARNHIQTPGEGARRPLQLDHPQAGASQHWIAEARCRESQLRRYLLRPARGLCANGAASTHTVLVHADGFEWNGKRYRSLTIVAREITGAHWSGPRFFGLRKCAGPLPVESAEDEHAQA